MLGLNNIPVIRFRPTASQNVMKRNPNRDGTTQFHRYIRGAPNKHNPPKIIKVPPKIMFTIFVLIILFFI